MKEFLVIPGQYSGDMWHVAAAMLVNPDVHAVITVLGTDDEKGAPVIQRYFDDVGLGERVTVWKKKSKSRGVLVQGKEEDLGRVPGKKRAWQHTLSVQRSGVIEDPTRVYPIYYSTAMIMRAIEEHGRERVQQVLRAGLTARLSTAVCRRITTLVCDLLAGYRGQSLLFVLGRIAGYNPQHDLDSDRLREICRAADEKGYVVVPVGFPPMVDALVREAGVHTAPCLDLRDWTLLTGDEEPDERARAYFWRCVVELAAGDEVTVKLVGGRSGSTDLPAFLGLDVLSWDLCEPSNPEYLRLLITSPSVLRLTHTAFQPPRGKAAWVAPDPQPNLGRDLAAFLEDTFVPPRLVFELSGNAKKKKAGQIEKLKRDLLNGLGATCRCLFLPTTKPEAFDKLATEVVDEVTDLSSLLVYGDGTREVEELPDLPVAETMPVDTLAKGFKTSLESNPQTNPSGGRVHDFDVEALEVGDAVRVEYHLHYDVVGEVTAIGDGRVKVRVTACFRPGTTTPVASGHTALVVERELTWRADQIKGKEG